MRRAIVSATAGIGAGMFLYSLRVLGLAQVQDTLARIGWSFTGILALSGAREVVRTLAWMRTVAEREASRSFDGAHPRQGSHHFAGARERQNAGETLPDSGKSVLDLCKPQDMERVQEHARADAGGRRHYRPPHGVNPPASAGPGVESSIARSISSHQRG